jgi:MFS transporter, DHA3 family, multidrug efflux protein
MTKLFYAILANSLVAALTNSFVWFAVTFWVYLQTQSVLVTSVMAGIYLLTVSISGFLLGSVVDRYRKQTAMMLSSICSLVAYIIAYLMFALAPSSAFAQPTSVLLWVFIILALIGAIAGNLRTIALSTLVTFLIPEASRDKANGLVGTSNGVAFLLSSIMSGLAIGFLGIYWMLVCAIGLTVLAIIHLSTLAIPEQRIVHTESHINSIDLRGTIESLSLVPGLFALIFFSTFNNFLGGVYASLMDAYGLSLVSVQVWGILWGCLSLGFIVGGLVVAKRGVGRNPLRTLFLANIVMWTIAMLFTIGRSIWLLTVGLFIYLVLIPIAEASEQTILQKVIPPDRQGRVFGFAQSIEQAASPLMALAIGPIAQFIFIPFMTTGAGVNSIGGWFGTGKDRGMALLFMLTGAIGLVVTLVAMRSRSYRKLSRNYQTY